MQAGERSRRADAEWDRRLAQVLDFKRLHGHSKVPRRWPDDPKLAHWVANQRRLARQGTLPEERLRRLLECGIRWEGRKEQAQARDDSWQRMLGALRTFQRTFGHLDVPRGWAVEPRLPAWMATQRMLHRRGLLQTERVGRLEELGFDWARRRSRSAARPPRPEGGRSRAWDRMLGALQEYHRLHGDCSVPSRWPADRKLAHWVANQRALQQRGRLSVERQRRLAAIGFEWGGSRARRTRQDQAWDRMCDAFGNCRPDPGAAGSDKAPDAALAHWIHRQRRLHRAGQLRADRVRRLDALGFSWGPPGSMREKRSSDWEARFAELQAYQRAHGHCNVPQGKHFAGLAGWVMRQRRLKRNGSLPVERRERLDGLGLAWSVHDQVWETRYAELSAFQRTSGHCDVPVRRNRRLASWVAAQRTRRKSGMLSQSRIARLDELGFAWAKRPPKTAAVRLSLLTSPVSENSIDGRS